MKTRRPQTRRALTADAGEIHDKADELLALLLAFVRDHAGDELPRVAGRAFPRGGQAQRRDALVRAAAGASWSVEQLLLTIATWGFTRSTA